MARQYKSYDEDFKKTIVNLYENGKGISELSREYGVGKSTIDSWIKKYKTIITSTGETTTNDEILKLQKKNRELEQEVEILKKAVAIFSCYITHCFILAGFAKINNHFFKFFIMFNIFFCHRHFLLFLITYYTTPFKFSCLYIYTNTIHSRVISFNTI